MRQVLLVMMVATQLAGCELPAPPKFSNSAAMSRRAVETPHVTPIALSDTPVPPDAKLGCWVVDADETKVLARWQYPCSAPLPTEKLALPANLEWPDRSLVLPALEAGEPPMQFAKTEARLEMSTAKEGVAGLLFLPAAQHGGGFYVAAWEATSGDAGWAVGLYGAPPASVLTENGRAYLAPEFKARPRTWRRSTPSQTVPPDADENAQSEAPQSTPALLSVEQPRALEM